MTDLERQVVELRIEFELAKKKVNLFGKKLADLEGQMHLDNSALIEEPVVGVPVDYQEPRRVRPVGSPPARPQPVYRPRPVPVKKEPKWDEAVVGKYLIGGAAALFIFLAAVIGVVLAWEMVSDAARFMLIVTPGLGLAACGFMFLSKWKNAITALMIGIGSGLVFIGVVAGYMVFNLFGDLVTVFLLTTWSLALTLSFKRTKMFFTSVISYIGTSMALILMLYNLNSVQELLITFVFLTVTLGAFLASTEIWMDKTKRFVAGLMAFVLPFAFICRLNTRAMSELFGEIGVFFAQGFLVVVLFGLCSYVARTFNKRKYGAKHIVVEGMLLFSGICLMLAVTSYSQDIFRIAITGQDVATVSDTWLWYLGTLVVFAVITLHHRKNFLVPLGYVALILMLASEVFDASNGFYLFSFTFGCGLLAFAVTWLKDLRFNKNHAVTMILIGLGFLNVLSQFDYWVFAERNTQIGGTFMVIEVASLVITSSILAWWLYKKYIQNERIGIEFYKLFLFVVVTVSTAFVISAFISPEWGVWGVPKHNGRFLTFGGVATLISVVALYHGYFISWTEGNIMLLRQGVTKRYELDGAGVIFSFGLTALFLYNLTLYTMTEFWYTNLIALLLVLVAAAAQSYLFFNRFRETGLAMVWLGIKYLIVTWCIMYTSLGIGIDTILTSIVGIGIAALSIYIGFTFRVKVLRIYGLVLTLLMTAKALMVDLNMDNPITLLFSLILGGAVCFAISVVYTRLERSLKEGFPEEEYELEDDVDEV